MAGCEVVVAPRVPVLKPRLPSAEALLPYLQRIDATRVYANQGPLVTELEELLARRFGVPAGGFVTAASGTAALAGAILATAGWADAQRPLAIVPGFTFVATAIAVRQCGYIPFFVDVDPERWTLDPAALGRIDMERVGVVVPVAPLGRPLAQAPWQTFSDATGIPVVIDAAAAFDYLEADPGPLVGTLPVAISLHATKAFSTGEGGGVITTDLTLAARITQVLNFGFSGSRSSETPSINGKMSEYHAAVGLAESEVWPQKRSEFDGLAATYRAAMCRRGIGDKLLAWPDISRCYVLVRTADIGQRNAVRDALADAGIETRSWYGSGVHTQPQFATSERGVMDVTEGLATTLLALPVAPDLAEATVEQIVAIVDAVIRGRP